MQKSPAKEVFESPEEETVKKFNRAREWAGLKLRQGILEKFIWPWLGDQSERDILYAAQTILKHNTKFMCKLMSEKRAKQLLEMMIINPRLGTKVYMVDPQRKSFKSAIIKHIKLYNALPMELKTLKPNRLKRKLRKLKVYFKE